MNPSHFILALLNTNSDFDVSIANNLAIDIAKCTLPGKVMQTSPCQAVCTLTDENGRYEGMTIVLLTFLSQRTKRIMLLSHHKSNV